MFSRQFKFRQKNFLGIDIGTRSLRMIELSHEKNNHKLENYALIPLQSQNEATIIATIKASLKNTKTNKAAFAFAHSAIIYQQINIAKDLSENELEKFLEFNLEKYVGQSAANISMDYQFLNDAQIQLTTARRERVKQYSQIAYASNLDLKIIDINSCALVRSINLQTHDIHNTIAIINIDLETILICISKNGVLLYAHEGFVANFDGPACIEKELRLCLESIDETPSQIFLAGEKFLTEPDLAKTMSTLLSIPISTINPFVNLKLSANLDKNTFNKIAPAMLIAYGLAMRSDYAKY